MDMKRLVGAWQSIVDNIPELHTRFLIDDSGEVRQWADMSMKIPIITRKSTDAEVRAYIKNGFVRPFDLLSGEPLFRIEFVETEKGIFLLVDGHHMIVDGTSFTPVLIDCFSKAYNGEPIILPPYGMYQAAEDEKASFDTEAYQKAKEYYAQKFEGLTLATLSSNTPNTVGKMGRRSTYINRRLCEDWCRDHGLPINLLFQAAFSHAMAILTRQERVAYFTVNHGRSDRRLRNSVGMFVKSVPILANASADVTVTDFIRSLRSELMSTIRYGIYPFTHFCMDLGLTPGVMFDFQALPYMEEHVFLGDTKFEATQPVRDETSNDLCVMIFFKSDDYEIRVESSLAMNDTSTLEMVASAVHEALCQMMAHPDAPLSQIGITATDEEQALVQLGRGPQTDFDHTETLVSLFRKQAAQTPDAVAVVFQDRQLTYRELDKQTDLLAAHLVSRYRVQSEEAIGVMTDRSELMVVYPLAIMKAGAAYMPLDFKFPEERLHYMCDDANVRLILSESDRVAQALPNFQGQVFSADSLQGGLPSCDVELPRPSSTHRFILLYTSGSTGKPKGVALEHHNIVNFCHWYIREAAITQQDRLLAFSNFGFDTHMMDIYPALFTGATTYIVPDTIRLDLEALHAYMEANNISIAFLTTQVGHLFATSFPNASLRLLVVAGEKLLPLQKPAYTVMNAYGPTECFVSTFYNIVHDYDSALIGRPIDNYRLYVVDHHLRMLPRGAAGELLIGGEGVARGYLHPAEKDAGKFLTYRGEKGYLTGDLVRWSESGDIEFLGRIDNQVKLRGFRIELGEIESQATRFAGVVQAVAVVHQEHTLCLYYTVDQPVDEASLQAMLAEELPDYMVPSAYIRMDVFPLTPNGKVDRRRLPKPEVEAEEVVAPATNLEQQLFDIVTEQLGTDRIGVTTNLISYGLTSLSAMRLTVSIAQKLEVNIPVNEIIKKPTIRHLAEWTESRHSGDEPDLSTYRSDDGLYPLTENQRGVYIDWEMNRQATQYNTPAAFHLGSQDAGLLAEALCKAVNAHPYVKARLALRSGEVMQQRRDDAAPQVTVTELTSEPGKTFFQQRVRPFDLFADDLYRLEIYTWQGQTWLFKDFHHIITDGLSDALFFGDVLAALQGLDMPAEKVTAFEYALYEQELKGSERYAEARDYFDTLLGGAEPAEYPHSIQPDGGPSKSATVTATVADSEEVTQACRRMGITANSYFQTVLCQVLHRLTRQEQLMLVTVSNGRQLTQTQHMAGMFVRTIPMTSRAAEGKTDFAETARSMHRQSIGSTSRDFYPLTEMVERHGLRPTILYAFQGGLYDGLALGEHPEEDTILLQLDTQKMPIELMVYPDSQGTFNILLAYDTGLYSRQDMQAFAHALANYALHAAKDGVRLADIELTTKDEQAELIRLAAGKHIDIDIRETFVSAFERQAAKTPGHIAVADGNSHLTYGELSRRSNLLAHRLTDAGVQPDGFVCVLLDRVKEFPLSVIAIMKAGGAYVPMDTEYPAARLQYILENSETKVLITSHDMLEEKQEEGMSLPEGMQVVFIDDVDFTEETEAINLATPDGLAYMIYTSGSTGRPKGAMLHHAGLWNFICGVIDMEHLTQEDRIAGHRSFAFDAHIEDMYPVLTLGGSFHIMPSAIRHDLHAIRDFLYEHRITGGGYATAVATLLLNTFNDLPMRFITAGGEKLEGVHSDHIEIINVYGPTECTDDTSFYSIPPGTRLESIPIGKPSPNTYGFIVDSLGQLVSRGASGELCIAGIQVGRGYWNQPELTSLSFCDCTFIEKDAWGRKVRMYHTGDLCRWNEEGQLEYIGRIDSQVKLRGFRIELGEIEACALRYGGITQAVAAVKAVNGADTLCLYFTAPAAVDTTALKAHLATVLTAYMVPTAYMQLPEMPLTPNGKVDRRRLPEPKVAFRTENVAPRTEKEAILLMVARQILGRNDFGITDDLFDLGLNSIGAIRLVVMATASGSKMSVNDLMRQRTIAKTLDTTSQLGYWHAGYDPTKPVLIVPHGVIYSIKMAEKFQQWQSYFSIYTIEPTIEHADRLFADGNFHDIIDVYADMLDRDIPRDAQVFAFVGYSWAGEQAYWLACRWQQLRGQRPNVYLGDSHIILGHLTKMAEQNIIQGAERYLRNQHFDISTMDSMWAQAAMKLVIHNMRTFERLHCTVLFPRYDGQVTLFNCLKENEDMAENLSHWREAAPCLRVIDVDVNHLDFCLSNQYTDIVTQQLVGDLQQAKEANNA